MESQKITPASWLDVCGKNWYIFREFLKISGYDPSMVEAIIQLVLEDPDTEVLEKSRLEKEWLTLQQYQLVENAVVETTGHVHHLFEAGRFSHQIQFGGSIALDKLNRFFFRHITEPGTGFGFVPSATEGFNENKTFEFVVTERGHMIIRLKYLPGPNGIMRNATEDYRSAIYYIPGIFRGVVDTWYRNEETAGEVKLLSVDVPPQVIIAREAEEAGVDMIVDAIDESQPYLCINGIVYGLIVEHGEKKAILITRDVETPCRIHGTLHPILRKGEIYRWKEPIETEYDIRWRKNRLFTLFSRSRFGSSKAIKAGLSAEARMADAEARLAVVNANSRVALAESAVSEAKLEAAQARAEAAQARADVEAAGKRKLRAIFERAAPSLGVADALLSGTFRPINLKSVIIQCDVVGFKRLSQSWGPVQTNQRMTRMFELIESIARKKGFFPFKRIGDALIIAYAEWPLRSNEASPYQSFWEAEDMAMVLTKEFHRLAKEELAIMFRIGVDLGEVLWCNQTTDPEEVRFDATGNPLTGAARAEAAAEPGRTSVTENFARSRELRLGPEMKNSGLRSRGRIRDKNGDPLDARDVIEDN